MKEKIKRFFNKALGLIILFAIVTFTVGFILGVCKIAWYGLGL